MRATVAGLIVLLLTCFSCSGEARFPPAGPGSPTVLRAVAPVAGPSPEEHRPRFERVQSTGLFVGISHFAPDSGFSEVEFAADDAVDLADLFCFELGMIDPVRVRLLLAGQPKKKESMDRLARLKREGATVLQGGQAEVYRSLESQVSSVGKGGIFVMSFATHGFSENGVHYLAAASTLLRYRETAVVTRRVFQLVDKAQAVRRLVLLDACREELSPGHRGTVADPRSAFPAHLVRAIGNSEGQAVFLAARGGGYAYDDLSRGNGVFSGAVMDGLRCAAKTDPRGFVTGHTLHAYVDEAVRSWMRVRGHTAPSGEGIEVILGGAAHSMPLAFCHSGLPADEQPFTLTTQGEIVTVVSEAGQPLWSHQVSGNISQAKIADLHGDGKNEVVLGIGGAGKDRGRVIVLDALGDQLWSVNTYKGTNYGQLFSGATGVRAMEVASLFGGAEKQVVVLAFDAQGWYPSRLVLYSSEGEELAHYWHPGHLHEIQVVSRMADSQPLLLVGGVNNDLRGLFPGTGSVSVVFLLDPRNIYGEAPPYAGASQPGSHLWYGAITPKDAGIGRLDLIDRENDRVREISVWTRISRVLYLDFEGRVVGVGTGDGAREPVGFALVRLTRSHP